MGDVTGKNVHEVPIQPGTTMRHQECNAVAAQEEIKKLITTAVGADSSDVTIFVEVGASAGALLVLVEAVKTLYPSTRLGAVVVCLQPVKANTAPEAMQDIDLLGRAIWEYTIDGRLSWSKISDGRLTNLTSSSWETAGPKRTFGSRLYGE
jgi:hypothetical protein